MGRATARFQVRKNGYGCRRAGQTRGGNPALALNSNLHGAVPDNPIRIIPHGIASPVSGDLGYMPGVKDRISDDQVGELVS
jgi:nicotinate dehydrogenase subunit B